MVLSADQIIIFNYPNKSDDTDVNSNKAGFQSPTDKYFPVICNKLNGG